MNVIEETLEATLDSNGELRLTHPPRLPPGPVRVTIRVASAAGPQRGLADVIREIAAEQRSRGFPGRSPADLRAEDDSRVAEDAERDRELDSARRGASPGGAVSAVLPGHGDRYLRRGGQPRRPATGANPPDGAGIKRLGVPGVPGLTRRPKFSREQTQAGLWTTGSDITTTDVRLLDLELRDAARAPSERRCSLGRLGPFLNRSGCSGAGGASRSLAAGPAGFREGTRHRGVAFGRKAAGLFRPG